MRTTTFVVPLLLLLLACGEEQEICVEKRIPLGKVLDVRLHTAGWNSSSYTEIVTEKGTVTIKYRTSGILTDGTAELCEMSDGGEWFWGGIYYYRVHGPHNVRIVGDCAPGEEQP
jgi:hypothetical protein